MYVHVVAVPDVSTPYACLVCLVPVAAGYPSQADDYLDGSLDLNQHLIKHPTATFFVRVAGESMREAGIHSGDVLIVDRSLTPSDGSVVIAVVNGVPVVLEQKTTILWKCLYLLASLKDSSDLGGAYETNRRGEEEIPR